MSAYICKRKFVALNAQMDRKVEHVHSSCRFFSGRELEKLGLRHDFGFFRFAANQGGKVHKKFIFPP